MTGVNDNAEQPKLVGVWTGTTSLETVGQFVSVWIHPNTCFIHKSPKSAPDWIRHKPPLVIDECTHTMDYYADTMQQWKRTTYNCTPGHEWTPQMKQGMKEHILCKSIYVKLKAAETNLWQTRMMGSFREKTRGRGKKSRIQSLKLKIVSPAGLWTFSALLFESKKFKDR